MKLSGDVMRATAFTSLCACAGLLGFAGPSRGEPQSLAAWSSQSEPHLVRFPKIAPTEYQRQADALVANVKSSAAAMIIPFKEPREIKEISLRWRRHSGQLLVRDRQHEESKSGDDAWWRVGLLVSGEAPKIPFFAPDWIKQLRNILLLPTQAMHYLVVGSQHGPQSKWDSPYSDSISCLSTTDQHQDDGWVLSKASLERPYKTVGLWLMADGDNTRSTFSTTLDLGASHFQ